MYLKQQCLVWTNPLFDVPIERKLDIVLSYRIGYRLNERLNIQFHRSIVPRRQRIGLGSVGFNHDLPPHSSLAAIKGPPALCRTAHTTAARLDRCPSPRGLSAVAT